MIEGYSTLDTEIAIINEEPFACVWFPTREDRTARIVLEANPHYWNTARGARLERVVFRNDIAQERAIELVCTSEGEVDIVTNIAPSDAARVENSKHAKLIRTDAVRVIAGIINRAGVDNPLARAEARRALNFAINRKRLVAENLAGYGEPSAGLTPGWTLGYLSRLSPYAHDAKRAAKLWRDVSPQTTRPLRLTCAHEHAALAEFVAQDIRDALAIEVALSVYSDAEKLAKLRQLAEKKSAPDWDVFIYGWSGQTSDAPPLELHYQFAGARGAWRAGETIRAFDDLYAEFAAQTNQSKQAAMASALDKFVYDEALALFLCSPQALYAVNREVDFTPYATTFELAECEVSDKHWSR